MMKEMLDKLMAKKDDTKMSPEHIQAKMDVLKELLDLAKSENTNRVKNGMDEMKKVTVAAPDEKSLEAGLDKAKDLVSNPESLLNSLSEESPEHEDMEPLAKESSEEDEEQKEPLEEKLMEATHPEMEDEEEDDSIFASKRPKSKVQKLMMD